MFAIIKRQTPYQPNLNIAATNLFGAILEYTTMRLRKANAGAKIFIDRIGYEIASLWSQ